MGKEDHNFYTLGVLRQKLFSHEVIGVILNGDLMPYVDNSKEIEDFTIKIIEFSSNVDMNKVRQQ